MFNPDTSPVTPLARLRAFFRIGIGLKRWLSILIISVFILVSEIGLMIIAFLQPDLTMGGSGIAISTISIIISFSLIFISTYRLYIWIVNGVRHKQIGLDILTSLSIKIDKDKAVKVVAIGGGTGQSTLLRGIKHWTNNITAVVTITDDGGSSGNLRDDLDMPPPGDARSCLIALSELDPIMEEMFLHRFTAKSSLNSHNMGNLFLAALYQKVGGFKQVLEAAGDILSITGKVVPVSDMTNLKLMAETKSGQIIDGESSIGLVSQPLSRVWIEPASAIAEQSVLEAISNAGVIVIGPGSLYTSIIPNFLVGGISDAVNSSFALKVFVCNVATQPHETESYDVEKHLTVFQEHTGVDIDHVVVNCNIKDNPEDWHQPAVLPIWHMDGFRGSFLVDDVLDESMPTRHDPRKLARAIMQIPSLSVYTSRK